LPNIDELRVLLAGCEQTQSGGACGAAFVCSTSNGGGICDDTYCGGCTNGEGPGPAGCFWPADLGGDCGGHISSTLQSDDYAYAINFLDGAIYPFALDDFFQPKLRCVRSL
jgi:hypothetical protein